MRVRPNVNPQGYNSKSLVYKNNCEILKSWYFLLGSDRIPGPNSHSIVWSELSRPCFRVFLLQKNEWNMFIKKNIILLKMRASISSKIHTDKVWGSHSPIVTLIRPKPV